MSLPRQQQVVDGHKAVRGEIAALHHHRHIHRSASSIVVMAKDPSPQATPPSLPLPLSYPYLRGCCHPGAALGEG